MGVCGIGGLVFRSAVFDSHQPGAVITGTLSRDTGNKCQGTPEIGDLYRTDTSAIIVFAA